MHATIPYASLLKHGRVERPESEHQPKGLSVKTLSGLLGHYSAVFTLDTYGHISTQMQQDAARKVGGFLRNNV